MPAVLVQADGKVITGDSELEVGGQAHQGGQGQPVAPQGCQGHQHGHYQ